MALLLSYIVPVYNTAGILHQCVDSLYAQDMAENTFEVILVNDGSNDGSDAVCKAYREKHNNIIYIRQENQGQGAARNKGLDLAKGKYIQFVDSDDYLQPHSIKKVLKEAIEKKAEIAKFLMDKENPDGSISKGKFIDKGKDKVYNGEEVILNSNDIGSVCGGLYLKELITSHTVRFLTDIKHEDVAFEYSLYPYVERVIFCNVHCYFYCYNELSTDRSTDAKQQRLLLYSNLRIARLLQKNVRESVKSSLLKAHISRVSNSIIVASILNFIKSDYYPSHDFYNDLKNLDLLPIKGLTMSWKTSIMLPAINFFFLISTILFDYKK